MLLFLIALIHSIVLGQQLVPEEKKVNSYNPCWSPDGKLIVFESTMDGKSSIYTIAPDGSRLKRITDSISDYGQPAWSPDGKQVVYYGGIHPMQLYSNKASGGSQRMIATPGADAYEPSWSFTGKIAFDSRDTGQTPNDISIIDADGKHLLRLTDSNYDYSSPEWSPDAKKILFERRAAFRKKWRDITPEERRQMIDSAEIVLMNSDGSGVINLTHDAIEQRSPAWSSTGSMVYYKTRNDTTTFLHSLNLLNHETKMICSIEGIVFGYSVSPDGTQILYSAKRNKHFSIYLYDRKSGVEKMFVNE